MSAVPPIATELVLRQSVAAANSIFIRSPRRHARAPWRHVEAKRLGSLEVEHQLVFGRCLHRKVGRLLALEDAVDVAGRAPVLVDDIGPVGDQAAGGDEEAEG